MHPARGAIDGHEQVAPLVPIGHLRQVLDVDEHEAGLVVLEGLGLSRTQNAAPESMPEYPTWGLQVREWNAGQHSLRQNNAMRVAVVGCQLPRNLVSALIAAICSNRVLELASPDAITLASSRAAV